MALVLIPGPDNAPSTVADWDKINDVLQTIGLDINSPTRISGTKILRGSVIFFAGAWYVADADTAITGSKTDYVRLTNSAGTVTAAFVPSLSNVTFNRTWNGWYDSSMRLYLFDEIKAYAAGAVTDPVTIKNYRPSLNWSKAISRVLSAANLARLFRLSSEVVLTGSGTWTVPSGVYWIEGIIIAPGEAGQAGSSVGGNGGDAGERRYFGYAVTPGQNIPYACTSASTVFGGTTVTAGGGETGGTGSDRRGGSGGGHGGRGGSAGSGGGSGTDTEGGGGGGGGAATTTPPYTPGRGGAGGLGSVRIR
jgi:hypothetical protein